MPYIPNLTQEQYDMTQPNGVGTNAVYDQDIFRSILVNHWANQIPELQDFIRGWVAKLNDPNFLINDPASLFHMEVEQQDWLTDRSQAWRDYDMMKIQDPETWAKNLELETQHVKDVLKSVGYEKITDSLAREFAEYGLMEISDGLKDYDYITLYQETVPANQRTIGFGSINQHMNQLEALSRNLMLELDKPTIQSMAEKIASDNSFTLDSAKDALYAQGRTGQFGFLGEGVWDRLQNTGGTLVGETANLRNVVGKEWGLQLGELKFNDPDIMHDYVVSDPDGKQRWMNSNEAKQFARTGTTKFISGQSTIHPRYKQSSKYINENSSVGIDMLRELGWF